MFASVTELQMASVEAQSGDPKMLLAAISSAANQW